MQRLEPSAQRPGVYVALALGYAAIALAVLWPALHGDFVSDDIGYIVGNPWIHTLSALNLRAILDPTGPAAAHTANYAPIHLLLHGLFWQLFGANPFGHHVVNVLFHAVASTLLVALFARAGVPFVAAALGGALFLLHPANVEAVAWVSQSKTIVALALASAALLLEPRRPIVATIVFALALLTKIQAAFAIPVVGIAISIGAPAGARSRGARVAVLGVWIALLVLALLPEMLAFERLGHVELATPVAPVERVRTIAAFAGRYLVMATTSLGVSAFHQPELPASWSDPWCLVGLFGIAAMAARALIVLARRSPEAEFWAWTVGGFGPVSQLLPFLYPIADRYLYCILPGLIGAGLVAIRAPLAQLVQTPRSLPSRAALLAAVVLLGASGWRSFERAGIWRSEGTLVRDAALHYPRGISAQLLRAQSAARGGDVASAIAALRGASARGYDRFIDLEREPLYEALRKDARFRAVIAEIAGVWIGHVAARSNLTAPELRMLGHAHAARGEWEPASARLEEAAARGGPGSEGIRVDLAEVRGRKARADREAARNSASSSGEADGAPTP
jgi:hypothetical protein